MSKQATIVASVVAFSGVVGGLIAGAVWALLAPGLSGTVVTVHGQTAYRLGVNQTNNEFSALAVHVIISAIVGLLYGIAAFSSRPVRGPLGVCAVVVGSLVGAAVSTIGGQWLIDLRFRGITHVVNGLFTVAPTLNIQAMIVFPLVTTLTYVALASVQRDPNLGRTSRDCAGEVASKPVV